MKYYLKTAALFIVLHTLSITGVKSQVRFPDSEGFAVTTMLTHSKNYGFTSAVAIEYKGVVYTRAGIEYADVTGSYFALQGSVGLRLLVDRFGETSIYGGFKGSFVRRNGYTNPAGGFEIGTDYTFDNGLLLGLNLSHIYHSDMVSVNLPEIWETHIAIRIGYSWGF